MKYLPKGPECSFRPPLSDLFFCFSTLSGLLCIQDLASLLLDIMVQISPLLRSPIEQEYSRLRQRRVSIKRFLLLLFDIVWAALYSGPGFPSPGYYGANLTTQELGKNTPDIDRDA
ncbi:hypothetical protein CEXT_517161 [Caerostris extrusa]|uniref:Uncharacterized protein n=1 Tax=Caerostris extrusa TaxID=172846 RepID=A0AAV4WUU7_CAEEX|nr:hypothetical protein CEXT_517161 [Caerostris extrusa]